MKGGSTSASGIHGYLLQCCEGWNNMPPFQLLRMERPWASQRNKPQPHDPTWGVFF